MTWSRGAMFGGTGTLAIVPVKLLAAAKQRLAAGLESETRQRLVLTMLDDVLATLALTPGIDGVLVVSRSPCLLYTSPSPRD